MAVSRDDIQEGTGRRTFYSGKGWLRAFGTKDVQTPTNGTTGYATGCTWQNPYGTVGSILFVNVGTELSSTWIAIT